MPFRASMPSFAGGEIGRQVRARYDVAKYQTALDKGRNTLGLPGGGQYNRPGTEFGDETHDMTRLSELFDWSFSDDQSYALEFSHYLMRVFYDGAPVTEPQLIVTAATQTDPLTVTVPASGWAVGDRIYFTGIEGMTEINGLTLRITNQAGDVSTFDVDATGWGAFTGSGGGVAGDAEGGTGGYPPPPGPGDPDPTPPDYPDTDPDLPHRCVWVEAWVGDGLRAGAVEEGSPLLMLGLDGQTYEGAVTGVRLARRPCLRLETVSGVVLTCSTTTPVPVMADGEIVQPRAEKLVPGQVVAVQDGDGFRWEALARVVRVEPKLVAQISANDGIYWAGDRPGRGIFTHNIKPGLL
jgi:hypothetical protein